jgi:hypothetical protein
MKKSARLIAPADTFMLLCTRRTQLSLDFCHAPDLPKGAGEFF